MFWLFLGNVQVQLFGAVPKEAFILASSLFPLPTQAPRSCLPTQFRVQLKQGGSESHRDTCEGLRIGGAGGAGLPPSSWGHLLKPTGKCDRNEEPRRGMKSSPQSQLFSDANIPAAGAKGQDTEQICQAGGMACPHRNLRPCWLLPQRSLSPG